ncbi:MAG: type II and III secretion system protein family protein [Pirellulaceae bacterium]
MSKQCCAVVSAIVGLFSAWTVLTAMPSQVRAQDAPVAIPDAVLQDPVVSPEGIASQGIPSQGLASHPVTFSIDGPTQRLEMVVATSRILTLEHKIPRLLVANPEVVKATPISPNQVQLSALHPGVTQLNVWDESQHLYTVDVIVTPDGRALQMLINTEFPDAAVRVRPLSSSVYLSGYVPSPSMVVSIVRIAEDYYPKVVNNMTIGGVQQILLKTKIMEVSRTKLRQVGFDWSYLDGESFVIQSVNGLINSGGVSTLKDTVRFGIVDGDSAFFGFIDALRRNDLIKVLAEPQLTTVSGRAARFQSGGEFPIIVPQSLGTVSIEYREYGTRVDFVPIVLGNGNLRLEVRPFVSEIDPARSVVIDGTAVPALRTRWVDTGVEIKAGQTLALAGLLQSRVEARNSGIPWLADVPWFGAPFRRVSETVNEIELLILVTPEFVEAVDPEELPLCGPGEATTSPNDVELYWRGYIEVPKCCEDGSCPECQQGGPGATLVPDESQLHPGMPQEVRRDASAKRPASQTTPSATKSAAKSTKTARSNEGSNRQTVDRKPALIGPVGYDAIK